ncbi:MAG TPA: hypothetical protein VF750_02585 [Sphingomicrobium sp.]
MLKFLIGPALMGAGYAAGSYYGADAEQLVHKSPSVTYAGLEQALANMRTSGTTSFEGGTPVPYEIEIDRTLDRKLVVHLLFAGRQGAQADIDLTSADGGNGTLVTTRVHADREVLRPVLAGTSKARLGYAPDWIFNVTLKPLLKQLAAQIEAGQPAGIAELSEGEARAQWEANLSDEQRSQVDRWRQYDATRPATDPDADANRYLENAGSN